MQCYALALPIDVEEVNVEGDRQTIEKHERWHQTYIECILGLAKLLTEVGVSVAVLQVAWLIYLDDLLKRVNLPLVRPIGVTILTCWS